jgi:polyvinyl alcohol dehydrogenase (cytochrome)
LRSRAFCLLVTALFCAIARAPVFASDSAPVSAGEQLFRTRCAQCHEPAVEHAPSRQQLALKSAAEEVQALTVGPMAPMAVGLSRVDVDNLAAYLSGGGAGAPAATPAQPPDNSCTGSGPILPTASDWASWGNQASGNRYQPHPGMTAADVPRLKLKWAFAYSGGQYGQPVVVGDYLFITSLGGDFYALDRRSGCVRWHVKDLPSRTTPIVARSSISTSGWAVYVGDDQALNLRAFDAQSGHALWASARLDQHPLAHLKGAAVLEGDTLYTPVTSLESAVGAQPTYHCCTFRGAVVAVDARSGAVKWRTTPIAEPERVDRDGNQLRLGPAGGSIWGGATADARRGLIYVGTGQSYTHVPTSGTDAVVAIEMATGKVRWIMQQSNTDVFLVGCNRPSPDPAYHCAAADGPDADFSAPPLLFRSGGRDVVVAGNKAGEVVGINPDDGRKLWETKVGSGSSNGGIMWGITSDTQRVFAQVSDIGNMLQVLQGGAHYKLDPGPPRPGLNALEPFTGKLLWHTPAPKADCNLPKAPQKGVCFNAESAATAAMPGAIFSGTTDGWFRAYDSATGRILWQFNATAKPIPTVDGIADQPGGGFDSMGPAIAGGMVFTMSGYDLSSAGSGNGVNVLLAFAPE